MTKDVTVRVATVFTCREGKVVLITDVAVVANHRGKVLGVRPLSADKAQVSPAPAVVQSLGKPGNVVGIFDHHPARASNIRRVHWHECRGSSLCRWHY